MWTHALLFSTDRHSQLQSRLDACQELTLFPVTKKLTASLKEIQRPHSIVPCTIPVSLPFVNNQLDIVGINSYVQCCAELELCL